MVIYYSDGGKEMVTKIQMTNEIKEKYPQIYRAAGGKRINNLPKKYIQDWYKHLMESD